MTAFHNPSVALTTGTPWRAALRMAAWYLTVGCAWMLATDRWVQHDPSEPLRLANMLVFVALSAVLICLLAARMMQRLGDQQRDAHAHAADAQRHERSFAQLLDLLPEPVLLVRHGRIVHANGAAEDTFGEGLRGELVGRSVLELVAPQQHAEVMARHARVLAGAQDRGFQPRLMYRRGRPFEASVGVSLAHFEGQPVVLKIVRDVDQLTCARREAEQAQQALEALSGNLIEVQERERRTIARELHDEIGQCLSAIRLHFARLQRRVQAPEVLKLIADASAMTEHTLARVRNLSLLLHPPQLEALGLEAALDWQVQQLKAHDGLRASFSCDPVPQDIDPDLAIAVYRIVQECLSNVVRHARATQVQVSLRCAWGGLELQVLDDGQGFDAGQLKQRWRQAPSLGLVGMTERVRLLNGHFEVSSLPGLGTRVSVSLPWQRKTAWRQAA